jgi:archaetidylinositol phosphate synthase
MLDRLRTRIESYLGAVGRRFALVATSPTSWTIVGLTASLGGAAAYATGGYEGAFVGGVMILLSGWFDIVDGAVARVTGKVSKRGAFLDSTLDRVGEVGIFVGVLMGGFSTPLAVLLALSASLLVSYTRARADSLGVALSVVGIGERSERLLILAVSSLLGYLGWGVLLVLVVAAFTFVERTVRASTYLR